jgi:hypothetical protein
MRRANILNLFERQVKARSAHLLERLKMSKPRDRVCRDNFLGRLQMQLQLASCNCPGAMPDGEAPRPRSPSQCLAFASGAKPTGVVHTSCNGFRWRKPAASRAVTCSWNVFNFNAIVWPEYYLLDRFQTAKPSDRARRAQYLERLHTQHKRAQRKCPGEVSDGVAP